MTFLEMVLAALPAVATSWPALIGYVALTIAADGPWPHLLYELTGRK